MQLVTYPQCMFQRTSLAILGLLSWSLVIQVSDTAPVFQPWYD